MTTRFTHWMPGLLLLFTIAFHPASAQQKPLSDFVIFGDFSTCNNCSVQIGTCAKVVKGSVGSF